MKTNISSLMNLISEKEKLISNKSITIGGLAINTTVEELDGRTNVIEDNKEAFTLDLKELEKNVIELSKLKAILYDKNNTFKLSDGRTIQQAIVDNTYLRQLKSTYEHLLMYKNSKRRVTEVNNSYFESKTINFNVDEIKTKLVEIENKIQATDFEISKLNSIEFEI